MLPAISRRIRTLMAYASVEVLIRIGSLYLLPRLLAPVRALAMALLAAVLRAVRAHPARAVVEGIAGQLVRGERERPPGMRMRGVMPGGFRMQELRVEMTAITTLRALPVAVDEPVALFALMRPRVLTDGLGMSVSWHELLLRSIVRPPTRASETLTRAGGHSLARRHQATGLRLARSLCEGRISLHHPSSIAAHAPRALIF